MVPVNTTEECVRVACERCGSEKLLHGVHYRHAVAKGTLIQCSTCTARERIHVPGKGGLVAETRLQAEPRSIGSARDFVRRQLRAIAVGDPLAHELTIATSEAVTNAILHGAPCPNGEIGLRVESNGGLTVEVSDCGSFKRKVATEDPLDTNGRGLDVIEALMDDVEVHAGKAGTTLRMVKRLPAPAHAAAA